MKRRLPTLPLLLGCLFGTACAIDLDDPYNRECLTNEHCAQGRTCFEGSCYDPEELPAVEPSVRFARDVQPIFDARCTACHSASVQQSALDLSAGNAWSELLGNGSGADSEECGSGAVRVMPGSPENSVLWIALVAQGDCVAPMPSGTAGLKALAPDEFELIERWILAGARDD